MSTILTHDLDIITRTGDLARDFGHCHLEAEIDVRHDGVYVNVHDRSLPEPYSLVSFAALRVEEGKLELISSSNHQLDVEGGAETRSDLYDPTVPYPAERDHDAG